MKNSFPSTGADKDLYKYFSFGIYIVSEVLLPELSICNTTKEPLLTIRYGSFPESIENAIVDDHLRKISKEEFLLVVKGVAKFLLKGKEEIVIDKSEGAEDAIIRIHLLSTLMAAVLHKHELLPLHASSIQIGNKAILIAGASGAGKSTTALGLFKNGHQILNDDISSIFFDENGTPYVHSGTIRLKLWSESLKKYGYEARSFVPVRANLEKYNFPLNIKKVLEPSPIQYIFFISTQVETELKHKELDGIELFDSLRTHTFRYGLVKSLGKKVPHFQLCGALVARTTCIAITRPQKGNPQELVTYIEEIIRQRS